MKLYFFVKIWRKVKIRRKVVWIALPPPLPMPVRGNEYLFFALMTYFFGSLDHRPAFYPLHFQCPEISLRTHFMWSSLPVSCPLWHLRPLQNSPFSHVCWQGFLPQAPGCIFRNSNNSTVPIPMVSSSFYDSTLVDWNYTSSIIIFCFFAALWSLFCKANSLSIVHFWKMSHGFITRRQEITQLHTSLSGRELNKICSGPVMDRLKDEMWLITDHKTAVI